MTPFAPCDVGLNCAASVNVESKFYPRVSRRGRPTTVTKQRRIEKSPNQCARRVCSHRGPILFCPTGPLFASVTWSSLCAQDRTIERWCTQLYNIFKTKFMISQRRERAESAATDESWVCRVAHREVRPAGVARLVLRRHDSNHGVHRVPRRRAAMAIPHERLLWPGWGHPTAVSPKMFGPLRKRLALPYWPEFMMQHASRHHHASCMSARVATCGEDVWPHLASNGPRELGAL